MNPAGARRAMPRRDWGAGKMATLFLGALRPSIDGNGHSRIAAGAVFAALCLATVAVLVFSCGDRPKVDATSELKADSSTAQATDSGSVVMETTISLPPIVLVGAVETEDGQRTIRLYWSPPMAVDVLRNDSIVAHIDGTSHRDYFGGGVKQLTYQVCNTERKLCSNLVIAKEVRR